MDAIKKYVQGMGYRANAAGKKLVDNPYGEFHPMHWEWRKGWLEYWSEAN